MNGFAYLGGAEVALTEGDAGDEGEVGGGGERIGTLPVAHVYTLSEA